LGLIVVCANKDTHKEIKKTNKYFFQAVPKQRKRKTRKRKIENAGDGKKKFLGKRRKRKIRNDGNGIEKKKKKKKKIKKKNFSVYLYVFILRIIKIYMRILNKK
jgi:hypothetical protein